MSLTLENDVIVAQPDKAEGLSLPLKTLPKSDKSFTNAVSLESEHVLIEDKEMSLTLNADIHNDMYTPDAIEIIEDPTGEYNGEYAFPEEPFTTTLHGRLGLVHVRDFNLNSDSSASFRQAVSVELGVDAPRAIGQPEQRAVHKYLSGSPKSTHPDRVEPYAAASGAVGAGLHTSSRIGPLEISRDFQLGVTGEVGTHSRAFGGYISTGLTLNLGSDVGVGFRQTLNTQRIESRLFPSSDSQQSGNRGVLTTTVGIQIGRFGLSIDSVSDFQNINPTLNQHRSAFTLTVGF